MGPASVLAEGGWPHHHEALFCLHTPLHKGSFQRPYCFPHSWLYSGPGTPLAGQAGSHCPPRPLPGPEDPVPNFPAPCIFTDSPSLCKTPVRRSQCLWSPPRPHPAEAGVPRPCAQSWTATHTLTRPPRGQNQPPSPSVRCRTWRAGGGSAHPGEGLSGVSRGPSQ